MYEELDMTNAERIAQEIAERLVQLSNMDKHNREVSNYLCTALQSVQHAVGVLDRPLDQMSVMSYVEPQFTRFQ